MRQIFKACPKNIESMSLLDIINTCHEEITYLLLKYSNNWYQRHLFLFFMTVKKKRKMFSIVLFLFAWKTRRVFEKCFVYVEIVIMDYCTCFWARILYEL